MEQPKARTSIATQNEEFTVDELHQAVDDRQFAACLAAVQPAPAPKRQRTAPLPPDASPEERVRDLKLKLKKAQGAAYRAHGNGHMAQVRAINTSIHRYRAQIEQLEAEIARNLPQPPVALSLFDDPALPSVAQAGGAGAAVSQVGRTEMPANKNPFPTPVPFELLGEDDQRFWGEAGDGPTSQAQVFQDMPETVGEAWGVVGGIVGLVGRLRALREARHIAVGHVDAAVSQQVADFAAGIVFPTSLGDATPEVLLGEGGAEAMDALPLDAQFLAGCTHGSGEFVGHGLAAGPQVVATGGQRLDGSFQSSVAAGIVDGIEVDGAFLAALGVGEADRAGVAVEVGFLQGAKLLMAQAGSNDEVEHGQKLIAVAGVVGGDVAADMGNLVEAVASSGVTPAQPYIESSRDQFFGRGGVPANCVQGMGEFAEGGQPALNGGLGQLPGGNLFAHHPDGQVDVAGGEVAKQFGADVVGEQIECGVDGLHGFLERAVAVDETVGNLGSLVCVTAPGGVTSGVDAGDGVQGAADLVGQGGAALPVAALAARSLRGSAGAIGHGPAPP